MKIFTNKKSVQKIIIAIVIVLSFNFIIPNYSQAGFGGVLMGPFIDFFAAIGDVVMSVLQFFFYDGGFSIGETADISSGFNQFTLPASKIRNGDVQLSDFGMVATDTPDTIIDSKNFDKGLRSIISFGLLEKDYGIPVIKYTPEAIFSNEVPALDVNFVNPKDWTQVDGVIDGDAMNEKSITRALHSTIANWYIALRNLAIVALLSILLYVGIRIVISSTASDKSKYKQMLMDWLIALCIVFFLHYIMSFILTVTDMITNGIGSASGITVQVLDTDGNIEFNTDLTGLCRLQVQYEDLGARLVYLIFYLALVIYTVMFTWTYVKRAITMAFLTLMAPLVAVTYPIDKINDGKAQAYGIWLKEFIFNALLQPFHLIIYTIFLGSSMEIAVENPIYAILFLAFIIPSEKLLRKMFGFEKASTAGAMSSAAGILGGAAVMKNASNLIGKVGGKGKGAGGKAGVRTKNNVITDSNAPSKVKDMAGTLGKISEQGNELKQDEAILGNGKEQISDNGYTQNEAGSRLQSSTTSQAQYAGSQPQLSQQTQARTRSVQNKQQSNKSWTEDDTRGMGEWIRDKWNDSQLKEKIQSSGPVNLVRGISGKAKSVRKMADERIIKNIPKPIRNTVRGAVGTAGKAAVSTAKFAGKAAVGATFGLAAGIAGDDLEDVGKFGLAGAALGVAGLPVLGRGISNAASSMRNTYETEAFGEEQAALREQAREKMKDDEYRDSMDELYQDIYGKEPTTSESKQIAKDGIDYYNAGITDTKEIRKSVKFEKELRERMIAKDGINEDEAAQRAKKQALVISNMASKIDEKELINESKRNDRRNQIFKQLRDTGMEEKAAASGADYTIQLLMKRKGLSPE